MLIYKYSPISKETLDNLINGNLWFSSPNQFNDKKDKMDSNLPFKKIDIKDIVEKHKNYLNNLDKELLKKMTPPKGLFDKKNQIINPSFESVLKDYKESFVGITCFSKRENNIEMWKEYGDNNKGICLCFETDLDSNFFKDLEEISYKEIFPIIDYSSDDLPYELKNNFSIKEREKYNFEEELRLFKHNHGPFGYKKVSLKKIIFGSNISQKNENIIRTIVSENYDSEVKLMRRNLL